MKHIEILTLLVVALNFGFIHGTIAANLGVITVDGNDTLLCDKVQGTQEEINELERQYHSINVIHKNMKNSNQPFVRDFILDHSQPGLAKNQFKRVAFLFHGGMGSGCYQANQARLIDLTRTQRRINGQHTLYVYLNGLINEDDSKNSSLDPFNDEYYQIARSRYFHDYRQPGASNVVEGDAVKAIYSYLKKTYKNLSSKIYTAGHSNGGTLQWKLAIDVAGGSNQPKIHGFMVSAGLIPRYVESTWNLRKVYVAGVHGQHDVTQNPGGSSSQFSIDLTVDRLMELYGLPSSSLVEDINDDKFVDDVGNTHEPRSGDVFANRVVDIRAKNESNKTKSPFRFFKLRDRSLPIFNDYNDGGPYDTQDPNNIGAGHCWHGSGDEPMEGMDGCTKMFPMTLVMIQMFTNFDKLPAL